MSSYKEYIGQNIAVFPCNRNKTPATANGFHDATTDPAKLDEMFRGRSELLPGIPTGDVNGIVVIDFDNKEHISIDQTIEIVTEEFGKLPETLTIATQSGGLHYYYLVDKTNTRTASKFLRKELPVDIRSNGGYVCGPDGSGLYAAIDDDGVFWTDLRSLCARLPDWIENFQKSQDENPHPEIETLPREEISEIRSALAFLDSSNLHEWLKMGYCLKSTRSPSAFHLWHEWSQKAKNYDPSKIEKQWKSLNEPSEVTIASLFYEAKKNGWVTTYPTNTPISALEIEEIDEKRNYDKAPFPPHLLEPPGIVGEMIDYINKSSKKRQPILALGAALAAAGTIMGQRFQTDQGLRTNLYILGVGESGCGKDAARSAIKKLFEVAGIGELAGTEDLASDSAVMTALEENPSQLFLIDEIGRFLKVTNQSSAKNSHLYNVISVLLKLYSSANQVFRGKSYADSSNKKVIDSPNLCIYGTTVPRSLFDGLSVENITDGFLSRFLIFESEDPDPKPSGRRRLATQVINAELINNVKEIFETERNVVDRGDLDRVSKVNPCVVRMVGDAESLALDYENFVYEKRKVIRKNKSLDNVYNRAPQFAEQIALIVAIGRNHLNPVIELDDMKYGIDLTNYLTDRMHFIALHHISNNELEAIFKKILNMVRGYGKNGITRSQFTRKTQYLHRNVREDILESLSASGQVKIAIMENGAQVIFPIKEKS